MFLMFEAFLATCTKLWSRAKLDAAASIFMLEVTVLTEHLALPSETLVCIKPQKHATTKAAVYEVPSAIR